MQHSWVTNGCRELVDLLSRYGSVEEVGNAYLVKVRAEDLPEVANELQWGLGGYYSTSVGADFRPIDGTYKLYHIFSVPQCSRYVVTQASLPPSLPKAPSITPVIPGANWGEREVRDMVGIEFEGHPEPKRLVLPHNWPEGIHPLRKDFPYDRKLIIEGVDDEVEHVDELARKYQVVPIGPYHPALHEPEYFELYVDGEVVVEARYKGFMVHRGIEKVAESRMTLNQVPFIAERICGICGFTHSCCYCQAVESALRIEVPERAKYVRTILLEIERIHSHLLWMGVALHVLGFDTGFMAYWRIREPVMRLAEELTGNRKTYGANVVGGVRWDIREDHVEKALRILRRVREECVALTEKVLKIKEVVSRMKGVGYLSREDARRICVVGPTARASGLDIDVRRDHPYAAYGELDFRVPVRDEGDVLARFLVRYEEVLESVSIVEQALQNLPKTPLINEDYEVVPLRIGVGATEAPRGEDVHLVVTGLGNKVYRWRPRAPSYNNIPATLYMLKGAYLADAPIIIASIDPCFSCTDHCLVIDVRSGSSRFVSFRELVRGGYRG